MENSIFIWLSIPRCFHLFKYLLQTRLISSIKAISVIGIFFSVSLPWRNFALFSLFRRLAEVFFSYFVKLLIISFSVQRSWSVHHPKSDGRLTFGVRQIFRPMSKGSARKKVIKIDFKSLFFVTLKAPQDTVSRKTSLIQNLSIFHRLLLHRHSFPFHLHFFRVKINHKKKINFSRGRWTVRRERGC